MREAGAMLIVAGVVLVALGLVFSLSGGLPWLGRLPGDIVIERPSMRLYFPITTSIIISIVVSLAVALIKWLR
jgi:uncharacterized membrane-anchored protein